MKLISLFSGAGGFDLGFSRAGFDIIWANDYEPSVRSTYELNHPSTTFCPQSIVNIPSEDIPECDGIIGGPPCQSWSIGGSQKGINDPRGKLFFEFERIIRDKRPKFFLAENVKNMTSKQNIQAFRNIKRRFRALNYTVRSKTLNAWDYDVPQTRERTFIIGIRQDVPRNTFSFPRKRRSKPILQDAIGSIAHISPQSTTKLGSKNLEIPNHEYLEGSFSSNFMSRNRVRAWNQPSFTILAMARHVVLHPQAPTMIKISKDVRQFKEGSEHLYRRLSVRECANIQTFPEEFIFDYDKIVDGYKMVGNAVPVNLAYHIAVQIQRCFDVR